MKIKKNIKKAILLITILVSLSLLTIYCFYLKDNKTSDDGIIVLAYHHFLPKEDKEKYMKDNYYVMSTEQFEEQMKYLYNNGYKSIDVDSIICYINDECNVPKKSFLVTIDDGNISSYYEALPILEKYNFKSINFIIGDRIGDTSKVLDESDKSKYYFLGRDLLEEIKNNHPLMTIGTHSYGLHNSIDGVKLVYTSSNEELIRDAKLAKEALYNASINAYPFGTYTEDYIEVLKKEGYSLSFTFNNNRLLTKRDNAYKLPRINIRADDDMRSFKLKLEGRVTFTRYVKNFIKKIF